MFLNLNKLRTCEGRDPNDEEDDLDNEVNDREELDDRLPLLFLRVFWLGGLSVWSLALLFIIHLRTFRALYFRSRAVAYARPGRGWGHR